MILGHATTDMIGYCAATMTTISFLPQLIRVVKLQSARDISLIMFSILTLGSALWVMYGLLTRSTPVWLANLVTLILSGSILFLKLKYERASTISAQPVSEPR